MSLFPHTGQGWVVDVNGEDWKFDPFGRLLDRPDPDTYDPCWCGSGSAFRFCHRDKHRQPCVTRAEFLEGWERSADLGMCLHPDAPSGCSDVIVRAHTVQRMGGGLRTIAHNGEVYGYRLHPYFFQKHDLRLVKPELIGTRKASTFRGFCQPHDSTLFKAAEDKEFVATQEQLFLLNFRAVARRVYGMNVAVRHAELTLGYDRGLSPVLQRQWFAIHYRELANAREALQNVISLKARYDYSLKAGKLDELNAFVAYFQGEPSFHAAELVAIRFDFAGHRLKEPDPPAHLCAYTLAVKNGWCIVFAWVGSNTAAEQLCQSFVEVPDTGKPAATLRYALEYMDTIFFAPRWWDSLSESQQTGTAKVLTDRLHPHHLNDPQGLITMSVPPVPSTFAYAQRVGPWSAT